MSQPRRSARIAARLAQLQPIPLDDDDTDSVVSASSRCEVCHEPAPRSALVHIPCCNYSTHRLCVDVGVEAMCSYCSMDLREALGQGVQLQCPLCGDSCGEDSDTVMFSCCPGAAFHVSCMATVVPGGREVISCPMCPESVRDHVSVERFQRLCHISVVPWPQLQPSSVPVECTLCADVMSDDKSVQVPCCQQHLHVSCLVRSFTSCGFHCPFCNQCREIWFVSGCSHSPRLLNLPIRVQIRWSFLLVSLHHQQGMSSSVALTWAPIRILEQLQDRRMEWSPLLVSDTWSHQWLCRQCCRTVGEPPSLLGVPCSRCGVQCPVLVTDLSSRDSGMWCPSCQLRTECENTQSRPFVQDLCTATAQLVYPRASFHVRPFVRLGSSSDIPTGFRFPVVAFMPSDLLVCWMLNMLGVFLPVSQGRVSRCPNSSECIGCPMRWIPSTLSANISNHYLLGVEEIISLVPSRKNVARLT